MDGCMKDALNQKGKRQPKLYVRLFDAQPKGSPNFTHFAAFGFCPKCLFAFTVPIQGEHQ